MRSPYNSTMAAGGGGMLGGALNSAMSPINSMTNALFPNPGNAAMPYEQQGMNQLPGYYKPYMQAGQGALGTLGGQYSQLLNNPGGMFNQIGQSYHQSPGFQFAMRQAMMGANQGAAAGGMAGSPSAMQNNMQIATGLGNQDYYNYMNNAMGMYGQGLQGEQGLAGLGYDASNSLGTNMGDMYNNEAQLAYAGQADQNQDTGGLIGDITGMFGGGH